MEWYHRPITSLEDLMGRVSALADSGVIQGTGFDVDTNLLNIAGLPAAISNDELTSDRLKQLIPIYIVAIRDMKEKGEESIILRPILKQTETKEKPEAAFILLSFLDLAPTLARFNPDTESTNLPLTNQLIDVSDTIISCYALQHWCRRVVSNYNQHHILVVNQAISILAGIETNLGISNKEQKKLVRTVVLEGNKSYDEGFLELHNTLARLVLELGHELPFVCIANTISIQRNVWEILTKGNGKVAFEKLRAAPNRKAFLKVLKMHKGSEDTEQTLQSIRLFLGGQNEMSFHEVVQGMTGLIPVPARGESVVTCGRPGCTKPAQQRCANCHLVSYCCKDCQRIHWKNGHSVVCKKDGLSWSEVSAASVRMGHMEPALQIQECLQSKFPSADYVVRQLNSSDVRQLNSSDGMLIPIIIANAHLKAIYSNARQEQNVHTMFRCLCKATTNGDGTESFPDAHARIAKQLQQEYGVDLRFTAAAGPGSSS